MMGKAARQARRELHPPRSARRWAGADGYEAARALNGLYASAVERVYMADGFLDAGRAAIRMKELQLDSLLRQNVTLKAVVRAHRGAAEPVLPGTPPSERSAAKDFSLEELADEMGAYTQALSALIVDHETALAEATPILFDPLASPDVDSEAAAGLRLPFPVTICDFLAASGMSMPVHVAPKGLDRSRQWVGLIAATMRQEDDGSIDVWPVVTTLDAKAGIEMQRPKALLFGRARLNGVLPPAPAGLNSVEVDGVSAWTMPTNGLDSDMWAFVWVIRPALAAASALRLLEAVNVSLEPAELPRPARRRAQREGAEPALEVVVRTSRKDSASTATTGTVDWQHRWTVRGHWKHFTRGPIFDANPRKRVMSKDGVEHVRVWCPPFVKGPDDKPLVLKARRADHLAGPASTQEER